MARPVTPIQLSTEQSEILNNISRSRELPHSTVQRAQIVLAAGSRYFCESFYGHPCPTSGKNYATANAFGGPSRPASIVAYPARGMQHRFRNDSTRFSKACIFTTQKTLRENTCTIASGDYSTPCDKLSLSFSCKVKVLAWNSKE